MNADHLEGIIKHDSWFMPIITEIIQLPLFIKVMIIVVILYLFFWFPIFFLERKRLLRKMKMLTGYKPAVKDVLALPKSCVIQEYKNFYRIKEKDTMLHIYSEILFPKDAFSNVSDEQIKKLVIVYKVKWLFRSVAMAIVIPLISSFIGIKNIVSICVLILFLAAGLLKELFFQWGPFDVTEDVEGYRAYLETECSDKYITYFEKGETKE